MLTLALGAWEGPLDLLLTLARAQKVDLAQISILALVDQYLAFVAAARSLRLELAADYLVMAAWLAFLKSALLLPPDPAADPDPAELALRLQHQLRRLDAMREAGARLMAGDRAGLDTFRRAHPEGLRRTVRPVFAASLFDLLSAYGGIRARRDRPAYAVARRDVFGLDAALLRLSGLVGRDWTDLSTYLPLAPDEAFRRSTLASSFAAALELTRQGRTELSQASGGAPVLVRTRLPAMDDRPPPLPPSREREGPAPSSAWAGEGSSLVNQVPSPSHPAEEAGRSPPSPASAGEGRMRDPFW